uniref:Uncharacterized protein n=1 Tax=Rhizophora mucronata TaxID=61149 RepID=A0A2P2NEN5_RHIMU
MVVAFHALVTSAGWNAPSFVADPLQRKMIGGGSSGAHRRIT